MVKDLINFADLKLLWSLYVHHFGLKKVYKTDLKKNDLFVY